MLVAIVDTLAARPRLLTGYIQVLKWLVGIDTTVVRIENSRCRLQEEPNEP